jgi:hypothetical protein
MSHPPTKLQHHSPLFMGSRLPFVPSHRSPLSSSGDEDEIDIQSRRSDGAKPTTFYEGFRAEFPELVRQHPPPVGKGGLTRGLGESKDINGKIERYDIIH